MPFNCPADYVYVIDGLDKQHVRYRLPGFDADPRVPASMKAASVIAVLTDGTASGTASDAASSAASSAGNGGANAGGSSSGGAAPLTRVPLGPRPGDRWTDFVRLNLNAAAAIANDQQQQLASGGQGSSGAGEGAAGGGGRAAAAAVVKLPRGATAAELRAALAPHEGAAFIKLQGFGPGGAPTYLLLTLMGAVLCWFYPTRAADRYLLLTCSFRGRLFSADASGSIGGSGNT